MTTERIPTDLTRVELRKQAGATVAVFIGTDTDPLCILNAETPEEETRMASIIAGLLLPKYARGRYESGARDTLRLVSLALEALYPSKHGAMMMKILAEIDRQAEGEGE